MRDVTKGGIVLTALAVAVGLAGYAIHRAMQQKDEDKRDEEFRRLAVKTPGMYAKAPPGKINMITPEGNRVVVVDESAAGHALRAGYTLYEKPPPKTPFYCAHATHPSEEDGGLCAPSETACWGARDKFVRDGHALQPCSPQSIMYCFGGDLPMCVPTERDCNAARDSALRDYPDFELTPCAGADTYPDARPYCFSAPRRSLCAATRPACEQVRKALLEAAPNIAVEIGACAPSPAYCARKEKWHYFITCEVAVDECEKRRAELAAAGDATTQCRRMGEVR